MGDGADFLEMEQQNLMAQLANANGRIRRLAHGNAEQKALIRELLPLARRMARAAEILTDGHASEHQPLIDRATDWLRNNP